MKIVPVILNPPMQTIEVVKCDCGCIFMPKNLAIETCPNCKAESTPTKGSDG